MCHSFVGRRRLSVASQPCQPEAFRQNRGLGTRPLHELKLSFEPGAFCSGSIQLNGCTIILLFNSQSNACRSLCTFPHLVNTFFVLPFCGLSGLGLGFRLASTKTYLNSQTYSYHTLKKVFSLHDLVFVVFHDDLDFHAHVIVGQTVKQICPPPCIISACVPVLNKEAYFALTLLRQQ